MSDRGWLFVFSLSVIAASLGVAAWLAITGQARYIDGLFLLISCLVLALAFGIYLRYLVRSAIMTVSPPETATLKAAAPSASARKPAPPVAAASQQLAGKTR